MTAETVPFETPARLATSSIVIFFMSFLSLLSEAKYKQTSETIQLVLLLLLKFGYYLWFS
jgi:hypothetical protein